MESRPAPRLPFSPPAARVAGRYSVWAPAPHVWSSLSTVRDVNEDGDVVRDDSVLLLFNAHQESVPFTMPSETFGAVWHALLDTSSAAGESAAEIPAGETVEVSRRAVVVLTRSTGAQKTP
jgi:isoamylase